MDYKNFHHCTKNIEWKVMPEKWCFTYKRKFASVIQCSGSVRSDTDMDPRINRSEPQDCGSGS
jgi:hypothetical protein